MCGREYTLSVLSTSLFCICGGSGLMVAILRLLHDPYSEKLFDRGMIEVGMAEKWGDPGFNAGQELRIDCISSRCAFPRIVAVSYLRLHCAPSAQKIEAPVGQLGAGLQQQPAVAVVQVGRQQHPWDQVVDGYFSHG